MKTEVEQEEEESDSEDKLLSPLFRTFLGFLALALLVLLPFLSVLADGSVLFRGLVQSLADSGVIWRLKAGLVREGMSFVVRGGRGGRKHRRRTFSERKVIRTSKGGVLWRRGGEKEEVRDSIDTEAD
jgi:hypothetical protein